jgi:ABC-type transport system involved in cytochrome c biogenesis permease subunit
MDMDEAVLVQAGLVGLGTAGLVYTLQGLTIRLPKALAPVGLWLGGLSLVAALVVRSVAAGWLAIANMYESILTVSASMTLTLAVLAARRGGLPNPWVGAASVWLCLALIAFGLTLPQDIAPLQAALRSYWRAIHVPIILLSYALFALNFATTAVQLIRRSVFKQPDHLALSEFAGLCAALGFPLVTIGIILGGVWANEAWGTYWNWDPKESMALATLLGYGVYLHLKLSTDASQTVLDWVAVGAFVLLLFTYFGVNLMGVGLHSYGAF